MKQKRNRYTAEFKSKVALEALKEQKTLSELASEYQIHPNQITEWKKRFLEGGPGLFSNKQAKTEKDFDKERDRLYRQIGELNVDIDFLKKKLK